jgi:hypothetical protein
MWPVDAVPVASDAVDIALTPREPDGPCVLNETRTTPGNQGCQTFNQINVEFIWKNGMNHFMPSRWC